jgi:hypothetical protein
MANKWINAITDDQIEQLVGDCSDAFRKARQFTNDDVLACHVAIELVRRYPRKSKVTGEHVPAYKGQISHLHALGIRNLNDLSWKEATTLTDCVLLERREEPYY